MLNTPDTYREDIQPVFPLYKNTDIHGSSKGLQNKLLGGVDSAIQIDQLAYCRLLSDTMKELTPSEDMGKPIGAKEINAYFTRERIYETLVDQFGDEHDVEKLTPKQQNIRDWFILAAETLRKKMKEGIDLELNRIKLNQTEKQGTPFGYVLQDRFELLSSIRADEDKRIIRGLGILNSLSPDYYYRTRVSKFIDQSELKQIFLNSFDLDHLPDSLVDFVSQPHLDKESFINKLADLNVNLQKKAGLHEALASFSKDHTQDEQVGRHAKLYSSTDTLLDYAGGVDGFIEITDESGSVVRRILVDVTTNKSAFGYKDRRRKRGESLADRIFCFDRDDVLPIADDPTKIRVLQKNHFRDLLEMMIDVSSERKSYH